MKKVFIPLLTAALVFGSGVGLAGDIAAGKAKSATCGGCHGANGVSTNPMWPNLAGQQEAYLAKQIAAFRDGGRSDPMMSAMVRSLSDTDIDDLAAYFSSLK